MTYNTVEEQFWGWAARYRPVSPELQRQQDNDPWHHASLELMRRMTQAYDDAMQLEDIPNDVRKRVMNRVLLGDPEGLEDVRARDMQRIIEQNLEMSYTLNVLNDLTRVKGLF